ncbi:ferric reductase-like transmembrane domain-containing protein [Streptacidiphilus jiangxiensis]|uniref:Ferric reductase like transmembrane component n=1 Tax=Streptacidiphilus jiangxiensis TaxID=235985 RepID=A0A1H7MY50_STRJI|nr:ferric reductase-like transmembrane domain-containing protein [Streptacidiphilus jiangxiensis]SEL15969.1 Ferric reductase like transmembrane component [Streptacidiphilus jiangxiensis]
MSSTTLWYASQATGIVSLVMFSAVMVLGALVRRRAKLPGLPRFGTLGLHRSISLLALVFLSIHILTAVADSYVSISLLDVVLAFTSAYRPLWLGLGTVAFDLLVAVVLTSVLRRRIGHRAWRAVHWLAYAMWPVAVVHGFTLGAGDGRTMHGWALALTGGCVLAVLGSVAYRSAGPRREATPAGLVAAHRTAPVRPTSETARSAGTPDHRRLAASSAGRTHKEA